MSRHLITLAALAALAGCSGGAASDARLISAALPPDAELDGAPALAAPPVVIAPRAAVVLEAPAPVYARVKDDSLWCDISVRRTPSGVRITPLIRSDRTMSGDYSLVITKSGAGGSSDISQGGPFDAPRGVKQALSASEFSLERGARFRAVLMVRAGGHEVCREVKS